MTRRPPFPRRSTLCLATLLLATPVLVSCGFDAATNRVNTIAMGSNDREGQVDVLAVVLVSAQPGSGTLLATLVNNDPAEAAELESIEGGAEVPLEVPELEPVEIAPRGRVVLSGEEGVPVTGEFAPGDYLPVSLTFASGEQSVLDVPVVPSCRQWEGLDISVEALAEPEPEPRAGRGGSRGGSRGGAGGSAATPSETPSPTAEESAGAEELAYECELPEPAAE